MGQQFAISSLSPFYKDRYDSCFRGDIHAAKVFPGLISVNIVSLILLINIKR